ncbi:hypothetical protein NMY22_g11437 [Coprinellus aureogranulatus]|nr:hypothetical protein NMY22_g11437 [Coprinellus aureogranulatus]
MPPTHQKALLLKERFGDFILGDVPVPKPEKDEVLLKVHSSALNPVDWKLGKYEFLGEKYPTIRGSDIAGEIVEVGEGVSRFLVGDRVFTQGVIGDNRQTGFQQYAIADTHCLAKIPPNLTYDDAATIPVAITAPYVGLYNMSPYGLGFDTPVRSENRGKYHGVPILILGGSSAVGRFALQLAKLSGFSPIITTASLKHEATLKGLGATHVLDRNAPFTEAHIKTITSVPISSIIDSISSPETQRQGFDILAPAGTQIIVFRPEAFWEDEGKAQDKKVIFVIGSKKYPEHATVVAELYRNFTELLESGDIKPHNVEVLPNGLRGIPDGLKRLEDGTVSNTKLVARPHETV